MAVYIDGKIKIRIHIKEQYTEEQIEEIKANTFVSCTHELTYEDYEFEIIDEHLDGTIKVRVKIQDPYTGEDIEQMKKDTYVSCPCKMIYGYYEYEVSDAD
jgi:hypothetical protein